MPLYDYCCPQGHLFEQMATIADPKTVSGKLLRRELRARGT